MTNQKRKHSQEFKAEAVKLAERTTVAQAAKKLALSASQIYDWRKNIAHDANSSELNSDLAAENAKLKRQLAEQKEELEILKKAATYFAKNLK